MSREVVHSGCRQCTQGRDAAEDMKQVWSQVVVAQSAVVLLKVEEK